MSAMLSCLMMVTTMSLGPQPAAAPAPMSRLSCVRAGMATEAEAEGALGLRAQMSWGCSTPAPQGFAILEVAGRQADAKPFSGTLGAVLTATVQPGLLPALACVELVTFAPDSSEPRVERRCEVIEAPAEAPAQELGIRVATF